LKKNPEIAKEVFTKIAKELIQNEVKQYNEIYKKVISNINEIKSNAELNNKEGKDLFNKLQNEEGKQYQKKLTVNEVERNINIVLQDKKGNDIIPVSLSNQEGKSERKDTKDMIRELKSRGVDISQVRNKKQIQELFNKANPDNIKEKENDIEAIKKEKKRESKEVEHEIG
jgi:phosphoribosylformylglycinamidine (FGAM) synthase-like amidotransferase family enzyme